MAVQYSVAARTSQMSQLATTIGVNAQIIIYSGAIPANVGTAPTGTLLVQFAGNAAQFGTAASGVLTASAVAGVNAAAAGTAGYFRINTSGGTAVAQGTVFASTVLATSSTTAANGNVLTFAAPPAVAVGQTISGAGVPPNTLVSSVSGNTVLMNQISTAGVASAANITFAGDIVVSNTNFAAGQAVTFTSLTITAYGA